MKCFSWWHKWFHEWFCKRVRKNSKAGFFPIHFFWRCPVCHNKWIEIGYLPRIVLPRIVDPYSDMIEEKNDRFFLILNLALFLSVLFFLHFFFVMTDLVLK